MGESARALKQIQIDSVSIAMKYRQGISALLTSTVLLGGLALPVTAQTPDASSAPQLLTDTRIDWLSGSSEWLNLTWTSSDQISNVQVVVQPSSKGLTVEYPSNHKGFTSLGVDETLSANEIDFTSVKISTDPASRGTKMAMVYVSWDQNGKSFRSFAGRLQFSNKDYKGQDFAIMTEQASVSNLMDDPDANWIEFNYKGLAPRTNNMKMTVTSDMEVYHPQREFTSLHHDETLHAGETDVARVWLDPEIATSGNHELTINITYTNHQGKAKTEKHKVMVKVK